ncbi:amidohydrolase [Kordiimonas gwangyangensis]|uniref:amidohydrolase n=2 Tax=Kordiimonas gwangyangensis TaxID=288022 RepID=UPI0003759DC7|nr:amidohydrolase [Kordiimonas gwangyangensis]
MTNNSMNRRLFLKAGTSTALAGGAALMLPARLWARQGQSADTVLLGGKIATLAPHKPFVTALAIKDDRILAVGSDSEMRAHIGNNTHVLDLKGRTVIPGLNDSHLHAVRGGRFYAAELRWDGVPSLEQGLNMIAEQAKRTPKGQWVRVVGGWSEFQFREKRLPTPEELDRAAGDVPVFVSLLYSQGYLNSAGLKALGITSSTKTPDGTRYEQGPDGRLTGRIMAEPYPTLLYQTIGKLPPLSTDEQVISTQHWYRELNRFGLTSAIDAGGGGHSFPDDYQGTAGLASAGAMPIRISYFLFPQRPGKELADFESWTTLYGADSNSASMANGYVLEGVGELLAYKASDYENFLSPRPDFTSSDGWDKDLHAVVRHLVRNRWPFRIHATYDQSANAMLDVFEAVHRAEILAGRAGFTGLRWAFDHGETYIPATIARTKALGGAVAVQARMAYGGEYFLERYGREAASNAPPLRALLNSGMPIGAGTDGTRVASYHPWSSLYWMVSGKTVGGTRIASDENRLSRDEALTLYTRGSAYFSGEQEVKGQLVPGQYADLAVLSDDYFSVGEEAIRGIEAVLTITGGRVVYGADEFSALAPALPALKPDWSPVHHYPGYYKA